MPQITINLSSAQVTRLQDAWEKLWPARPPRRGEAPVNPRPSVAEVQAYLVKQLKEIIVAGEQRAAEQAAPAPTPFDPT
jgi:hypothetical protein